MTKFSFYRIHILSTWLAFGLVVNSVWATTPKLQFLISNQMTKSFTLNELKGKLKIQNIEIMDPHYAKRKRYSAFLIQDVLQLAYDKEWGRDIYTDVIFIALDGYKAVGHIPKLRQQGGYLTFADLDFKDWEPVGRKGSLPGPFYVVWTGRDQTTADGFPWPWQLGAINIMRFQDEYPEVFPQGVDSDTSVYQGFKIFKDRCFRCHAMNQQGGKIGPDLNAPKSILAYRTREIIKEFIKHPSKYRYTQMPDHLDLTEQQLNSLLDYFGYKNTIK